MPGGPKLRHYVIGITTVMIVAVLCGNVYVLAVSYKESANNQTTDVEQDVRRPKPPPRRSIPEATSRKSSADGEPTETTVEDGESLADIADEHQGVSPCDIFAANRAVEDPNIVYSGQQLEIPDGGEKLPERQCPRPAPKPAPEPEPEPEPRAEQIRYEARSASTGVWDRLAQCESGGNWSINTGNGFYGGLQFHPDTWARYGGHKFAPNAHQASRDQEIVIAERVLANEGWGAWPACSQKLGLR